MSDYKYDDQHGAEFKAWHKELYANRAVGVKEQRRIHPVFSLHPNGRMVESGSSRLKVPVDKYGLEVRVDEQEPSAEQDLELRWDAALLEFPYTEVQSKTDQINPLVTHLQRAALLGEGQTYRGHDTEQYIQGWKDVGFSPELYCLLHSMIWSAVAVAKQKSHAPNVRGQLSQRLSELHLGTGALGTHGDNLQPNHWVDLPRLMRRVKFSDALVKIILFV